MSVLNPTGMCQCGCGTPAPLARNTVKRLGHVKGEPTRFCIGHNMRKPGQPRYVERNTGFRTPCWIWQGATAGKYGYMWDGTKASYAHRVYYANTFGPISPGLHIDHLCRQQLCVNPDHLEAVTPATNVRRGSGAVLTEDDVREIRREARALAHRLASQYGVSARTMEDVVFCRSWTGVEVSDAA